ncbi:MAG: imidazole glycerol phosphate synthase subunit HisF [Dethiobacteria bacterium]
MMMKRIIPCLDVKAGRVVKGVKFTDFKDAGDPVELAAFYDRSGADELFFLDITASLEGREALLEVVRRAARKIKMPLAVGGGIRSLEQMQKTFQAGAGRISLNTPAVENPALIADAARAFGRNSIVVAIDARWEEEKQDWEVYTHGGSRATGKSAADWAVQAEKLGAGEILLTSMDADGGRDGFDLPLTKAVSEKVQIPIIASGGAGKIEHFADVLTAGRAAAALAASVFHYRRFSVEDVKKYLRKQGLEVRLTDEFAR